MPVSLVHRVAGRARAGADDPALARRPDQAHRQERAADVPSQRREPAAADRHAVAGPEQPHHSQQRSVSAPSPPCSATLPSGTFSRRNGMLHCILPAGCTPTTRSACTRSRCPPRWRSSSRPCGRLRPAHTRASPPTPIPRSCPSPCASRPSVSGCTPLCTCRDVEWLSAALLDVDLSFCLQWPSPGRTRPRSSSPSYTRTSRCGAR